MRSLHILYPPNPLPIFKKKFERLWEIEQEVNDEKLTKDFTDSSQDDRNVMSFLGWYGNSSCEEIKIEKKKVWCLPHRPVVNP